MRVQTPKIASSSRLRRLERRMRSRSKKKSDANAITTHGIAKRHQRFHSNSRAGISMGTRRAWR
jgi:hypothetical protein